MHTGRHTNRQANTSHTIHTHQYIQIKSLRHTGILRKQKDIHTYIHTVMKTYK